MCSVTGTDKETFLKICETYARKSGPVGKSGTIMYAMGTTQHTHGTQNIRSYAILQLLLGNIGVAGGGINALRGESNVQGSTDHCLAVPHPARLPDAAQRSPDRPCRITWTLNWPAFATSDPKSANWWLNYPKYYVSLLKSWYGDNATADNDFGYRLAAQAQPRHQLLPHRSV